MQEKHHKGLGKECCSHFIRYSFCSLFVVLTLASLFILYEIQILYHTEIRGFILGNNVVASGVGLLREFVPEYDRLERVIKENLIYSELLHADSFNFWEMKEMGFRVRVPSEEEEVYFGYFQAK